MANLVAILPRSGERSYSDKAKRAGLVRSLRGSTNAADFAMVKPDEGTPMAGVDDGIATAMVRVNFHPVPTLRALDATR